MYIVRIDTINSTKNKEGIDKVNSTLSHLSLLRYIETINGARNSLSKTSIAVKETADLGLECIQMETKMKIIKRSGRPTNKSKELETNESPLITVANSICTPSMSLAEIILTKKLHYCKQTGEVWMSNA